MGILMEEQQKKDSETVDILVLYRDKDEIHEQDDDKKVNISVERLVSEESYTAETSSLSLTNLFLDDKDSSEVQDTEEPGILDVTIVSNIIQNSSPQIHLWTNFFMI